MIHPLIIPADTPPHKMAPLIADWVAINLPGYKGPGAKADSHDGHGGEAVYTDPRGTISRRPGESYWSGGMGGTGYYAGRVIVKHNVFRITHPHANRNGLELWTSSERKMTPRLRAFLRAAGPLLMDALDTLAADLSAEAKARQEFKEARAAEIMNQAEAWRRWYTNEGFTVAPLPEAPTHLGNTDRQGLILTLQAVSIGMRVSVTIGSLEAENYQNTYHEHTPALAPVDLGDFPAEGIRHMAKAMQDMHLSAPTPHTV